MPEELKPLPPEEELAMLERQLQEHQAKRAEAERQFRGRMDVVVSRWSYDTAILATQYRIDQIHAALHPRPQVYDPTPRKVRRI